MAIFKDKSNKIIFGNGFIVKTNGGGKVKLIGIDFNLSQPIIGIYYPSDPDDAGGASVETWGMNGAYHGTFSDAMNLRPNVLQKALLRLRLKVPVLHYEPQLYEGGVVPITLAQLLKRDDHIVSFSLKPFDMFDEYIVTSNLGRAYHLICYDPSIKRPWIAVDLSSLGNSDNGNEISTFNSDGSVGPEYDEVIEELASMVPDYTSGPVDDDQEPEDFDSIA